jgi:hypothetical protein
MKFDTEKLLSKGVLSGREIALLLIHDYHEEYYSKKKILSESEIETLWQKKYALSRDEQETFRILHEGYIDAEMLRIDVQTVFFFAKCKILQIMPFAYFCFFEPFVADILKNANVLEALVASLPFSKANEKKQELLCEGLYNIEISAMIMSHLKGDGNKKLSRESKRKLFPSLYKEAKEYYRELLALRTLYTHFEKIFGVKMTGQIDSFLEILEDKKNAYNGFLEPALYEYKGTPYIDGTTQEKLYEYEEGILLSFEGLEPNYESERWKGFVGHFEELLSEYPLPT